MKVLILIQCTNLGGMERNMLCTADEFQKLGIGVEVVSIAPVGPLGAVLAERGIPCEGGDYKGPFGLLSLPSLHRRLASKKADALLMIGHNFMGELALGRLWHGKRVLSIHYHHQGVLSRAMWWLVYKVAVRKFRELIFVSRFIRDEAVAMMPFLKSVPMRVSTPVVLPELPSGEDKLTARARMGIPAGAFVVGNAGWLIERKRWDVFLRVAGKFLAKATGEDRANGRGEGKPVVFLIAGDGPLRHELEELAEAQGLQGSIRWLGWQENLRDFYRAIDVLLFNSDWDAQARTPLEAMAQGIAVVASVREGGTEEFITDKSVGFLLKEHDERKLADMLLCLLRDPSMLAAMGRAARRRVEEKGSPAEHVKKVLEAIFGKAEGGKSEMLKIY